MDQLLLTVFYSCPACGLVKAGVAVPARGDEDVRVWMDQVVALTGADHQRRSPTCHPRQLHDLMIPVTGAAKIGGPAVQ